MIFEYQAKTFPGSFQPAGIPLIIQKIKHMLPEYIYDTAQLENNPITVPEIKTLIDGITIGGRKIADVQQILNLKEAWYYLMDSLKSGRFKADKQFSDAVHFRLGKEAVLEWGVFRNGNVNFAGASNYNCPDYRELDEIYEDELPWVMSSKNAAENALRYFLWGSLNQFYWDCNKRVSRMVSIGILVSNGYGILNIPSKHVPEFNSLMVNFYDTRKADHIMKFLIETSLKRIERKKEYYFNV